MWFGWKLQKLYDSEPLTNLDPSLPDKQAAVRRRRRTCVVFFCLFFFKFCSQIRRGTASTYFFFRILLDDARSDKINYATGRKLKFVV